MGQALVKIRNFEDAEKMLKRGLWILNGATEQATKHDTDYWIMKVQYYTVLVRCGQFSGTPKGVLLELEYRKVIIDESKRDLKMLKQYKLSINEYEKSLIKNHAYKKLENLYK